ncbi:DNA helicase [Corynebacterium sp. 13CS0277]|nr:cory-CC-star protein [Corynebacterium sp. 13CS0277]PRQ11988.1 DNA helicase [Corynebacterium sp. 13CS0277]
MRQRLRDLGAGLHEFYHAPYRASLARAARDHDDLFMLNVMAEALGIPNPAAYHTLELTPILIDNFHAWHTRMGMERSPWEGISCC